MLAFESENEVGLRNPSIFHILVEKPYGNKCFYKIRTTGKLEHRPDSERIFYGTRDVDS